MALTYGSRGNDVLEYQKKMLAAGLNPGPLDGIWGQKTDAAHKNYQASLTQAANQLTTNNTPTDPTAGLMGLRSTAERMGANVGWTPETGATINGAKVDTSGLKPINGHYYGTPDQILGILGTTKAPEYENPIFKQDEISALVQKILNPEAFSWNKDTDPAYQSILASATANGEKAFNNNIADLTSLTGGRLNSWAAGQASQARADQIAQADAQIPSLYQLAYGMWQDKQGQNMNALNALLGIDDTYYGRSRDAYGDFRNSVNTALGLEDQKYQRGVDQRNYERDVLESDRNYDRGALESDRNYNRGVLESDRNYNLNLRQENRLAASDSSNEKQITDMGTPAQVEQFYRLLEGYSGGGNGNWANNPAGAYSMIMQQRGIIEKAIGSKLYQQLLSDIKGLDGVVGTVKAPASDSTLGAIYAEMMNAPDPVAWLKGEAKYMTDAEIKQAVSWLPKDSNANEILAELLK